MTLKVGDPAPLFEGVTDTGEPFRLGDHVGKRNVVVYFYPKDDTPGCTKEACAFRDSWDRITSTGALVVGVSSDSVDSHRDFKKKYNLPFTLVSDPKTKIREAYGVKGLLIPPRVTFVIDKKGRIVHVYNNQLNPEKHVEEALKALQTLGA
jgi:peroxiredoxin Q/BCP